MAKAEEDQRPAPLETFRPGGLPVLINQRKGG